MKLYIIYDLMGNYLNSIELHAVSLDSITTDYEIIHTEEDIVEGDRVYFIVLYLQRHGSGGWEDSFAMFPFISKKKDLVTDFIKYFDYDQSFPRPINGCQAGEIPELLKPVFENALQESSNRSLYGEYNLEHWDATPKKAEIHSITISAEGNRTFDNNIIWHR